MAANSNKSRAFYEAPKDRPLASDIINQARSGLNAVRTSRPFTPKTDTRSPFGLHQQRSKDGKSPLLLPTTPKGFEVDVVRPNSGSRLVPIHQRNESQHKLSSLAAGSQKQDTENRRLSGAWEPSQETERHLFNNVVKSRTTSMSNLTHVEEKEGSQKSRKSMTNSESFGSALPPTSPTRFNRPRSKTRSQQQQQFGPTVGRVSSAEQTVGPSSSSRPPLRQRQQTVPLQQQQYRPDSGSSCCSSSSSCGSGANKPYRMQRYRTKSLSRRERSQQSVDDPEDVETPRPAVNSTGDHHSILTIEPDDASESAVVLSSRSQMQHQPDQDQFYRQSLRPILDILAAPAEFRGQDSAADFIELTRVLHDKLEQRGLLGKHSPYRAEILKAVFKVLDTSNEVLVMSAARIILAMRVRDINLTNICKLIFKLSKSPKNDHLFKDYGMFELLLKTMESIKPEQNHTALTYLTCTLKFLAKSGPGAGQQPTSGETTSSEGALDHLVKAGMFRRVVELVQVCVELNIRNQVVNHKFAGFLMESLECLISLEGRPELSRKDYVQARVPALTALIIQQYDENSDGSDTTAASSNSNNQQQQQLVFAASRLLSRLSQFSDCCLQLEPMLQDFCPRCLCIILNSRDDHLVLRVAFIAGDLLTKSDEARYALLPDKTALDRYMRILTQYTRRLLPSGSASSQLNQDNGTTVSQDNAASVDDIIVKLLRVVANAAIADRVGRMIASSKSCLRLLLTLINSERVLHRDELLTISISVLNNISFYMTSTSSETSAADVKAQHLKIIESLYKLIANTSGRDHLGGVIRVLGNLSREPYMRQWILDNGLDEFLITMLDSDNQDTLFFTVGVLLNLMTDPDKRYILLEHNAISGLIEVLRDFASRDWQLAGLVCQTLWNYTETSSAAPDTATPTLDTVLGASRNTEELVRLLNMFCDEEEVETLHRAANPTDESAIDYMDNIWQAEFLPVGQELLSRLESRLLASPARSSGR